MTFIVLMIIMEIDLLKEKIMTTNKIKFASAYAPPVACCEPKCKKTIKDYRLDHVTGNLEEIGEKPFYDIIQSHLESCKLDNILKRAQMGDLSSLNARPGSYLDLSDAPSSLEEVYQRGQNAKAKFESLPADIRELFGNSYSNFAKALSDGSFESTIREHFTASATAGTAAGTAAASGIGDSAASE